MHTREAIAERLEAGVRHSYLKDFIYGAIDGAVTTFAVVSGVAGAGLSSGIVIILGFANLIADGFSMAVSNYLGTRAEKQTHERARKTEEIHVETVPEGEREEIRQIFRKKGFEGSTLDKIVEVITSDKEKWIDVMLAEEYGISPAPLSPVRAGVVTFFAFLAAGLVPLAAFLVQWAGVLPGMNPFLVSFGMTLTTFFLVGMFKSRFVEQSWFHAGSETLLVGAMAALLAYGAGMLLKTLVDLPL